MDVPRVGQTERLFRHSRSLLKSFTAVPWLHLAVLSVIYLIIVPRKSANSQARPKIHESHGMLQTVSEGVTDIETEEGRIRNAASAICTPRHACPQRPESIRGRCLTRIRALISDTFSSFPRLFEILDASKFFPDGAEMGPAALAFAILSEHLALQESRPGRHTPSKRTARKSDLAWNASYRASRD